MRPIVRGCSSSVCMRAEGQPRQRDCRDERCNWNAAGSHVEWAVEVADSGLNSVRIRGRVCLSLDFSEEPKRIEAPLSGDPRPSKTMPAQQIDKDIACILIALSVISPMASFWEPPWPRSVCPH